MYECNLKNWPHKSFLWILLANLLDHILAQRLEKDFCQPFLLVKMNEDTVPAECSDGVARSPVVLWNLWKIFVFPIDSLFFWGRCLSVCGRLIEGTEWLIAQVALEAKTKSITTGLMSLLLSSPLTNVSVCHATMHYDHLSSWRSMTVRLRPLLLSQHEPARTEYMRSLPRYPLCLINRHYFKGSFSCLWSTPCEKEVKLL